MALEVTTAPARMAKAPRNWGDVRACPSARAQTDMATAGSSVASRLAVEASTLVSPAVYSSYPSKVRTTP